MAYSPHATQVFTSSSSEEAISQCLPLRHKMCISVWESSASQSTFTLLARSLSERPVGAKSLLNRGIEDRLNYIRPSSSLTVASETIQRCAVRIPRQEIRIRGRSNGQVAKTSRFCSDVTTRKRLMSIILRKWARNLWKMESNELGTCSRRKNLPKPPLFVSCTAFCLSHSISLCCSLCKVSFIFLVAL